MYYLYCLIPKCIYGAVICIVYIYSITNFITSSPLGLIRSSVVQSTFNSSLYYVNVTWTPSSNQIGTLQIFCFRARSSTG